MMLETFDRRWHKRLMKYQWRSLQCLRPSGSSRMKEIGKRWQVFFISAATWTSPWFEFVQCFQQNSDCLLFINPPGHSSPILGSVAMLVDALKDSQKWRSLRGESSQVCSSLMNLHQFRERKPASSATPFLLKYGRRKFHSRIFYDLVWFDHSLKSLLEFSISRKFRYYLHLVNLSQQLTLSRIPLLG